MGFYGKDGKESVGLFMKSLVNVLQQFPSDIGIVSEVILYISFMSRIENNFVFQVVQEDQSLAETIGNLLKANEN